MMDQFLSKFVERLCFSNLQIVTFRYSFFLEKQMITFFLHYMKQKHGRYICVQLLQTLNILFENISNETSLCMFRFYSKNINKLISSCFLDYLLSNNHINNIITHKFDFADEEIMAYYISFLKTLSLKLNNHSIHFFFNEVILNIGKMFLRTILSYFCSNLENVWISSLYWSNKIFRSPRSHGTDRSENFNIEYL